jgi:adenine/guanine/hypoxanthine permease
VFADQGHRLHGLRGGHPALLAIILMPLTYSITVGIGAGFVMWVLIKAVKGKVSQVPILMWVVAAAFVIYFAQDLLGSPVAA